MLIHNALYIYSYTRIFLLGSDKNTIITCIFFNAQEVKFVYNKQGDDRHFVNYYIIYYIYKIVIIIAGNIQVW